MCEQSQSRYFNRKHSQYSVCMDNDNNEYLSCPYMSLAQFEECTNIRDVVTDHIKTKFPTNYESQMSKLNKYIEQVHDKYMTIPGYRSHKLFTNLKFGPKPWLTKSDQKLLQDMNIPTCKVILSKKNIIYAFGNKIAKSVKKRCNDDAEEHIKMNISFYIEEVFQRHVRKHGSISKALLALENKYGSNKVKKIKRLSSNKPRRLQFGTDVDEQSLHATRNTSGEFEKVINRKGVADTGYRSMGDSTSTVNEIHNVVCEPIDYAFLTKQTNLKDIISIKIKERDTTLIDEQVNSIYKRYARHLCDNITKEIKPLIKLIKMNDDYFKRPLENVCDFHSEIQDPEEVNSICDIASDNNKENASQQSEVMHLHEIPNETTQSTIYLKTSSVKGKRHSPIQILPKLLSFKDFRNLTNIEQVLRRDIIRKYPNDHKHYLLKIETYIKRYYDEKFISRDTWPEELLFRDDGGAAYRNLEQGGNVINSNRSSDEINQENQNLPTNENQLISKNASLTLEQKTLSSQFDRRQERSTLSNELLLNPNIKPKQLSFTMFKNNTNIEEYLRNDIVRKYPLTYNKYLRKLEQYKRQYYIQNFIRLDVWPPGLYLISNNECPKDKLKNHYSSKAINNDSPKNSQINSNQPIISPDIFPSSGETTSKSSGENTSQKALSFEVVEHFESFKTISAPATQEHDPLSITNFHTTLRGCTDSTVFSQNIETQRSEASSNVQRDVRNQTTNLSHLCQEDSSILQHNNLKTVGSNKDHENEKNVLLPDDLRNGEIKLKPNMLEIIKEEPREMDCNNSITQLNDSNKYICSIPSELIKATLPNSRAVEGNQVTEIMKVVPANDNVISDSPQNRFENRNPLTNPMSLQQNTAMQLTQTKSNETINKGDDITELENNDIEATDTKIKIKEEFNCSYYGDDVKIIENAPIEPIIINDHTPNITNLFNEMMGTSQTLSNTMNSTNVYVSCPTPTKDEIASTIVNELIDDKPHLFDFLDNMELMAVSMNTSKAMSPLTPKCMSTMSSSSMEPKSNCNNDSFVSNVEDPVFSSRQSLDKNSKKGSEYINIIVTSPLGIKRSNSPLNLIHEPLNSNGGSPQKCSQDHINNAETIETPVENQNIPSNVLNTKTSVCTSSKWRIKLPTTKRPNGSDVDKQNSKKAKLDPVQVFDRDFVPQVKHNFEPLQLISKTKSSTNYTVKIVENSEKILHNRDKLKCYSNQNDSIDLDHFIEDCSSIVQTKSNDKSTTTASQLLNNDNTYFKDLQLCTPQKVSPLKNKSKQNHVKKLKPLKKVKSQTLSKVSTPMIKLYKEIQHLNFGYITHLLLNRITLNAKINSLYYESTVAFLQPFEKKSMKATIIFHNNGFHKLNIYGDSLQFLLGLTHLEWNSLLNILQVIETFEYTLESPEPIDKSLLVRILHYLFKSLPKFSQVTFEYEDTNINHARCVTVSTNYHKPVESLTKAFAPFILESMKFVKEKL